MVLLDRHPLVTINNMVVRSELIIDVMFMVTDWALKELPLYVILGDPISLLGNPKGMD